jgi:hypothetical protein
VYPSHQLLNAWTNLYETWYLYHGNWVLHKSHSSVNVCLDFIIAARQRHGNIVTDATCNRRNVAGVVFYAVRVVSKESRLLVFPRTCLSVTMYWSWCNTNPCSIKWEFKVTEEECVVGLKFYWVGCTVITNLVSKLVLLQLDNYKHGEKNRRKSPPTLRMCPLQSTAFLHVDFNV